jgi:hypothetical protein
MDEHMVSPVDDEENPDDPLLDVSDEELAAIDDELEADGEVIETDLDEDDLIEDIDEDAVALELTKERDELGSNFGLDEPTV